MKAKIAKLWVKALRSGQYKQGRGQLRNRHDQFCCLGVLCNLHAQAHPEFAAAQRNPRAYGNSGIFPVEEVCEWAGLKYHNPSVANTGLSVMNDAGKSFACIADKIEKNVDKL